MIDQLYKTALIDNKLIGIGISGMLHNLRAFGKGFIAGIMLGTPFAVWLVLV